MKDNKNNALSTAKLELASISQLLESLRLISYHINASEFDESQNAVKEFDKAFDLKQLDYTGRSGYIHAALISIASAVSVHCGVPSDEQLLGGSPVLDQGTRNQRLHLTIGPLTRLVIRLLEVRESELS